MFEPQVRKGVEHALSNAVRWSVGDDVMYTVNIAVWVALEDAASDVLGDAVDDAAQWDLEHSSLEIFSEEALCTNTGRIMQWAWPCLEAVSWAAYDAGYGAVWEAIDRAVPAGMELPVLQDFLLEDRSASHRRQPQP